MKNSIFSKPFMMSLFFVQNKYHQHGVLVHTMRVVYYTLKAFDFRLLSAAFFHDLGKPFVAFKKDDEYIEFNEYRFTDHEEISYEIVKNWFFLSDYSKKIIRYHYLIRDIKKSKQEDLARHDKKLLIWNSLDDTLRLDLERFLKYDDLGKGKSRRP
jgi:hypothetical protein